MAVDGGPDRLRKPLADKDSFKVGRKRVLVAATKGAILAGQIEPEKDS
jgi:hypothetical protein